HARRDECDDLERRLLGCRLDLGDDLARAHHVAYLLGHRDDLAGDRAADLRARCAPRLGALHLRPEPLETDLALASLLAHVADLLVVAADLAHVAVDVRLGRPHLVGGADAGREVGLALVEVGFGLRQAALHAAPLDLEVADRRLVGGTRRLVRAFGGLVLDLRNVYLFLDVDARHLPDHFLGRDDLVDGEIELRESAITAGANLAQSALAGEDALSVDALGQAAEHAPHHDADEQRRNGPQRDPALR